MSKSGFPVHSVLDADTDCTPSKIPSLNGHSQQPSRRAVCADVPISLRIADLRREIEGIRKQNGIYRFQKCHGHQDQVANERRKVRLEEIMQQLAALRPKRDLP
jgi:hypothetical protein